MRTLTTMENTLAAAGKPVSRRQLHRYLRLLNIKPAGRCKPALYPVDTTSRIAELLGLADVIKNDAGQAAPTEKQRAAVDAAIKDGILPLEVLKRARRGGKGGA